MLCAVRLQHAPVGRLHVARYSADQLVAAHIGRVTGAGIMANVKQALPKSVVTILATLLVVANTIDIAADLAAMGLHRWRLH